MFHHQDNVIKIVTDIIQTLNNLMLQMFHHQDINDCHTDYHIIQKAINIRTVASLEAYI